MSTDNKLITTGGLGSKVDDMARSATRNMTKTPAQISWDNIVITA
jgi:molybdopterin-biosynthesis enzyme MoeA-like protein